MISIIFCSRIKDNPASNLIHFLDSIVATTTVEERELFECLIKFDDDDNMRPDEESLAKYPFTIRTFAYSRGEGRHYLHHAQEYMFTQRDPRTRFCLMTADDFHFFRPNWVTEILEFKDEFCIIGHNRPNIEDYAGIYEREEAIRKWVVAFGELSPVISVRLVEVCQNFGWQSNVDSWLMGLSVVLYDLYKIVLWKRMPSFYARGGGYGLGDTPTYNNMELTGQKGPFNKYWFELLRRQARNLYLNMEYGTEYGKTSWMTTPRRLWNKLWSQPIHCLPIRICRRVWRDMRKVVGLPV